jgi:hypothetical protein
MPGQACSADPAAAASCIRVVNATGPALRSAVHGRTSVLLGPMRNANVIAS